MTLHWEDTSEIVQVPDLLNPSNILRRQDTRWVLRREDGEGIASFVLSQWPDSYDEDLTNLSISRLSVKEEWRGQGYGDILMQQVNKVLEWDRGGYLLVHKDNLIAKSLYAKHGWEPDPTWECDEKISPGMCKDYEWWDLCL